MSKSQLIKFTGWAFILGAFGFITILANSDSLTFAGSVISAILLAAGMLGLRARYGGYEDGLARNILLIGVIATVLFYIGLASLAFMYSFGILPEAQIEAKGLWILIFGGPAIVLLGLTLFGISTLRSKPMARLNWLSVLAGIWYPVVYFFLAGYLFTHYGEYPGQYQTAFNIMHLMQFLALCALGSFLVSDMPEKMATA
jgi:hypothetical protein